MLLYWVLSILFNVNHTGPTYWCIFLSLLLGLLYYYNSSLRDRQLLWRFTMVQTLSFSTLLAVLPQLGEQKFYTLNPRLAAFFFFAKDLNYASIIGFNFQFQIIKFLYSFLSFMHILLISFFCLWDLFSIALNKIILKVLLIIIDFSYNFILQEFQLIIEAFHQLQIF